METLNKYLLQKIFIKSHNLFSLLQVSKSFRDIVKSTTIYKAFEKANKVIDDKTVVNYMFWGITYDEYAFVKYILNTAKAWPYPGTIYDGCMSLISYDVTRGLGKLIRYCVKKGTTDKQVLSMKFDTNYKISWKGNTKDSIAVLKATCSLAVIKYLVSKISYSPADLSSKLADLPRITDDLECYWTLINCGAKPSEEFYHNIVGCGRLCAYKYFIHENNVVSIGKCLNIAASNGQLDLLKYQMSNLDNLDLYSQDLLKKSILAPDLSVLEYLLEKGLGTDINPLFIFAWIHSQHKITDYLMNHWIKDINSLFLLALRELFCDDLVKYLVDKGADVCYSDNIPIVLAMQNSRYELTDTIKLLIRKGANVFGHLNDENSDIFQYALLWSKKYKYKTDI